MKVLLSALAICVACPGVHAEDSVYVDAVRCIGGPFGMKLPADARKIRSLGPLAREAVSEVERWDGYTATRKTLYFDGLELGVVEFSNDSARLMVTHAEVTSPKWNHLLPFKVRQPASAVQAVLGDHAKGDAGLSRIYSSETDSVRFTTSAGAVVRVSYSCYSG